MDYVSLREVLLIHAASIKKYGGSQGIRDQGSVESAIARPRASFNDYEAYPDIYSKAATLLEALIKNHGFIDGNKRTAISAVVIFFQKNNYDFVAGQKQLVEFVVEVAEGRHNLDTISSWLKKNSQSAK